MPAAVSGNPNYAAEMGLSKFNSWAQELIAIDIIRRNAHNEFIAIDYQPERILSAFASINEIYRILRPLVNDKAMQKEFDERALKIRDKCLAHFRDITTRKRNDPYAETQLNQDLWNELDDYFTDIYTMRHLLGLGIRKMDKAASPEEFKKKMVREL